MNSLEVLLLREEDELAAVAIDRALSNLPEDFPREWKEEAQRAYGRLILGRLKLGKKTRVEVREGCKWVLVERQVPEEVVDG